MSVNEIFIAEVDKRVALGRSENYLDAIPHFDCDPNITIKEILEGKELDKFLKVNHFSPGQISSINSALIRVRHIFINRDLYYPTVDELKSLSDEQLEALCDDSRDILKRITVGIVRKLFGRKEEIDTESTFKEGLEQELLALGVPVSEWGHGQANALEDLIREIKEGESKLVVEDGKVIRVFNLLDVDVFYKDEEGNLYKLKEDRQEYVNGRVRQRDLKVSLMEKLKPNEEGYQAVQRALEEELGITGDFDVKDMQDKKIFEPAYAYPGTFVDCKVYMATIYLNKDQFNAQGYKEIQPGRKTTYFVWEMVALNGA